MKNINERLKIVAKNLEKLSSLGDDHKFSREELEALYELETETNNIINKAGNFNSTKYPNNLSTAYNYLVRAYQIYRRVYSNNIEK